MAANVVKTCGIRGVRCRYEHPPGSATGMSRVANVNQLYLTFRAFPCYIYLRQAACHHEITMAANVDTIKDPKHKLPHMLPPKFEAHFRTRKQQTYNIPIIKTERHECLFIPTMCCKAIRIASRPTHQTCYLSDGHNNSMYRI